MSKVRKGRGAEGRPGSGGWGLDVLILALPLSQAAGLAGQKGPISPSPWCPSGMQVRPQPRCSGSGSAMTPPPLAVVAP